MKQTVFENRFSQEWEEFEKLLQRLERASLSTQNPDSQLWASFSKRYRRLCHYLSMAKERGYSHFLTDYLNQLVVRGHAQLYHHKPTSLKKALVFFSIRFPFLIRHEHRAVLISGLLFFLPLFVTCYITYIYPDFVYLIFDPSDIINFETMYESSSSIRASRTSEDDFAMFGYYIFNNIGVGFRCFAGGMLFGLGSVFFLVFNGIVIGTVSGHMIDPRFASTFFSFVIGHGAFELTAIVFSGAAGLNLGAALLSPGRLKRVDALKQTARKNIQLIYGVIVMLVVAAFIEAFWSSSATVTGPMKLAIGAFFWFIVIIYFLVLGRRHGS